ncbi:MAG: class I SAM-dependent methyltransferase [Thermodesulfobacteriota bacterium]
MTQTNISKPKGAGKSSFDLIDSKMVFKVLGLEENSIFLDMACGSGAYSLAAAEHVGAYGRIYAVDLWQEGIETLRRQAQVRGFLNIRAIVTAAGACGAIENESVDVCLLATALHDMLQTQDAEGALKEAARVLKQEGRLIVIEFKKISGPPGPSVDVRLAAEEVEALVRPHGFKKDRSVEVGPYNYLIQFSRLRTLGA